MKNLNPHPPQTLHIKLTESDYASIEKGEQSVIHRPCNKFWKNKLSYPSYNRVKLTVDKHPGKEIYRPFCSARLQKLPYEGTSGDDVLYAITIGQS